MKHKHPEKDLQVAIWQYLMYRKVFCWIDYQPPGREQFCRHPSSIGVADILGVYKGRPLAIEVKVGRNKLSEQQEIFLNRITKEGGIAFCAWSLEDVQKILDAIS